MSAPRPHDHSFRYALALVPFAAVAFVALIVASFGFVSLFSGRDVIPETDAGTALGPLMVLVATIALILQLVFLARGAGWRPLRMPVLRCLAIAFFTGIVYVATGAVLYAFATAAGVSAVIFAARHATDGFALALAASAGVVALSYFGALLSYNAGRSD